MSGSSPATPLLVRLRNWVGDVILGLPALEWLEAQGYRLVLIGKPWAADLLAGHGWEVHALAKGWRARRRQYLDLAAACSARDPGFARRTPNAVVYPFSFSSALDARLAGLRSIGYAHEGRGWLLTRALTQAPGGHEIEKYWQLAQAVSGTQAPLPSRVSLRLTEAARQEAMARLQTAGLRPKRFIVLAPFASGPVHGRSRHWPGFAELAARFAAQGLRLLVLPGPGELAEAQALLGRHATVLDGVRLSAYAALAEQAALVIANDSGPGHLAAAVGTPLLTLMGPTDPARWRAWAPQVTVLREPEGWPDVDAVEAAAAPQLQALVQPMGLDLRGALA